MVKPVSEQRGRRSLAQTDEGSNPSLGNFCGRSSVVEHLSFGLWYVTWFKSRRPHFCTGRLNGRDRELIARRTFDSCPVRFGRVAQ